MRSSIIVAVGRGCVVSAGPAAQMRGRFIRRFQPLAAVLAAAFATLVVRVTLHGGGFIGCVVYGVGVTNQGGVGLHHAPLHIAHRVTLNYNFHIDFQGF